MPQSRHLDIVTEKEPAFDVSFFFHLDTRSREIAHQVKMILVKIM